MEKPTSRSQHNHQNQSQEFSRSSFTFYPSPSALTGESSSNQIHNNASVSKDITNSFKSPYDIEENQFNLFFNNSNNEDDIKDNNLRNNCQKKKIMESNSLIKQKYVTFILDNNYKSTHSLENANKYNSQSNFNGSRIQSHETIEETRSKLNQGENKNINNIQARSLKSSNVDQRSARKSFIRPSATSTSILNRRLATAKTSQRKKDNFLGSSLPLCTSNSQSETNSNTERISKKSPVVSIIIDNLY